MIGHEKGYYITKRTFSLPELKIMIDAIQAASFITKEKTVELIDKIVSLSETYKKSILTGDLVCFNTRKHINEGVYDNIE